MSTRNGQPPPPFGDRLRPPSPQHLFNSVSVAAARRLSFAMETNRTLGSLLVGAVARSRGEQSELTALQAMRREEGLKVWGMIGLRVPRDALAAADKAARGPAPTLRATMLPA